MLRIAETTLVSKTVNRLVRDLLDIFILYTLNGGPRSGYDIKKLLAQLFGVKVSYGSLYPHLHSLESSGLAAGQWVPHAKAKDMQKKQYSLTETGRMALRADVEGLSRMALTLQLELAGVRREIVAREISPLPLTPLSNLLRSKGYRVQVNTTLQGKSGTQHDIDLLGIRTTAGTQRRVLFAFVLADSPIRIQEVIRHFVTAYDLESDLTVLIAVPSLAQEARRLAEFYNMKAFEGTDLDRMVEAMPAALETVL